MALCLGENQIKFSFMRIKFAPHFCFFKKETARLLKALAEFSCFIFLMNWKKIEENSGKKALQQEM